MRGQHDDLDLGIRLQDAPGRLEAAHAGHGHVHQDHVRRIALDDLERLLAAPRRAHVQAALRGDGSLNGLRDRTVVIHDQHGDPLASSGLHGGPLCCTADAGLVQRSTRRIGWP